MTRSENIERLEAVIGSEARLELSRQFGGTPISVPKTMRRDHAIPLVIGWRAAQVLAEAFGGSKINVPTPFSRTAIRHAEARRLRAEGMTVVKIARSLGYTTRYVRKILNG